MCYMVNMWVHIKDFFLTFNLLKKQLFKAKVIAIYFGVYSTDRNKMQKNNSTKSEEIHCYVLFTIHETVWYKVKICRDMLKMCTINPKETTNKAQKRAVAHEGRK